MPQKSTWLGSPVISLHLMKARKLEQERSSQNNAVAKRIYVEGFVFLQRTPVLQSQLLENKS